MLEVKNFGKYEDLSLEDKRDLYHFREINDFIETDSNITKEQVHKSYLKVISSFDMEGYEEIDYQVKKIVDNTELGINSILGFLEKKFVDKLDLVNDFFFDKGLFFSDENLFRFLTGEVSSISTFSLGKAITFTNELIVGENNTYIILEILKQQFFEQIGEDFGLEDILEIKRFGTLNSN